MPLFRVNLWNKIYVYLQLFKQVRRGWAEADQADREHRFSL